MSFLADTMPAWSYIWYIAHIITDCLLLRSVLLSFLPLCLQLIMLARLLLIEPSVIDAVLFFFVEI